MWDWANLFSYISINCYSMNLRCSKKLFQLYVISPISALCSKYSMDETVNLTVDQLASKNLMKGNRKDFTHFYTLESYEYKGCSHNFVMILKRNIVETKIRISFSNKICLIILLLKYQIT